MSLRLEKHWSSMVYNETIDPSGPLFRLSFELLYTQSSPALLAFILRWSKKTLLWLLILGMGYCIFGPTAHKNLQEFPQSDVLNVQKDGKSDWEGLSSFRAAKQCPLFSIISAGSLSPIIDWKRGQKNKEIMNQNLLFIMQNDEWDLHYVNRKSKVPSSHYLKTRKNPYHVTIDTVSLSSDYDT